MNLRYKLLVFDVDGTLLDPLKGVTKSVRYAVKGLGLPEIPIETIKSFIGPPIRESLKNYYQLSDEDADSITQIFRDQYKNKDIFDCQVYDGIFDLLEILTQKNYVLSVATYKRHDYAVELLEYLKIAPFFKYIHGSDNYEKTTKEDIIKSCIRDSKIVDLKDIVMIGDTNLDAISAQKIGIDFMGVIYGYGFKAKEDLNSFPHVGIAESAEQLIQLFE